MLARRIDAATRREFGKLGNYCRDAGHDGEKCMMSWHAGCYADDFDLAIVEIKATQAMNSRAVSDKTYHLMVSFRPEDEAKLTPETLRKIEETLAQSLGLAEHQRVVGVHKNTNNLHMHVAYNLIHPEKFTIYTPFQDYPKLSHTCRVLEKEFGLTVDKGIEASNPLEPKITQRAAAMEAHSGEQSFQSFILEQRTAILAEMNQAKGWQEAHQILANRGIFLKEKGNGIILVNRAGKETMKVSALDRGMSKAKLVTRFGPYQQPLATENHQAVQKSHPLSPKQYSRKPLHPSSPERNRLYQEYKTLITERKMAIDAEKAQGFKTSAHRKANNTLLYTRYLALSKERRAALSEEKIRRNIASANLNECRDRLYKEFRTLLEEQRLAVAAEQSRRKESVDGLKQSWLSRAKKAIGWDVRFLKEKRPDRLGQVQDRRDKDVGQIDTEHKERLAIIEKKYPFKDFVTFLEYRIGQGDITAPGVLFAKENRQRIKDEHAENLAKIEGKYPFRDFTTFLEYQAAYGNEMARITLNEGEITARIKADREIGLAAIREQYPFNNWHSFLQHRSEQGDETALAVLRSREAAGKTAPLAETTMSGHDEEHKADKTKKGQSTVALKADKDRLYQEYQNLSDERREALDKERERNRDFFETLKSDPERNQLYEDYQRQIGKRRAEMDAEYTLNRATFDQLNERWLTAKGKATNRAVFGMMLGIQKRDRTRAKEEHQKRLAEIEEKYPFKNWKSYLQHHADKGDQAAITALEMPDAIDRAKEEHQKQLAEIEQKYPFKGWKSFLRYRADQGNEAAIVTLKMQQKKVNSEEQAPIKTITKLQQLEQPLVRAGLMKEPIFAECSQRIDNRGIVIFTLKSGGTIRDTGDTIYFSTDQQTTKAARNYALAKFGDHSVEKNSTIKKIHATKTQQNTQPNIGILRDTTRNGVRKLSGIPMVCHWKKPELLLSHHAHHDLER